MKEPKAVPTVDEVSAAFCAIASDLAQCCEDAGERPRAHLDDLTDAVSNYLFIGYGPGGKKYTYHDEFFPAVKKHLKALYQYGRSQYVDLR